jgi:hypothetical protein
MLPLWGNSLHVLCVCTGCWSDESRNHYSTMALAALRGAIAAGRRSGASVLAGGSPVAAVVTAALQTRGLSSHSENTNVFIKEVGQVQWQAERQHKSSDSTAKSIGICTYPRDYILRQWLRRR